MWLPKRDKTFGTKTLIATLRVLALLRTCAVHLTLIHIWCGKQKNSLELMMQKYPWSLRTGCELYLHTCVFQLLWVCIQACMNKVSLPLLDPYSCVRRYCHCTCAYFHGLTGENQNKVESKLILIDIRL